ncbi:hypothetical protein BC829DRAFT_421736 [Chytridium lagenaria]|nr:hypothetical protein BC829DRAFT_421736 [Chytridium lagenaria]
MTWAVYLSSTGSATREEAQVDKGGSKNEPKRLSFDCEVPGYSLEQDRLPPRSPFYLEQQSCTAQQILASAKEKLLPQFHLIQHTTWMVAWHSELSLYYGQGLNSRGPKGEFYTTISGSTPWSRCFQATQLYGDNQGLTAVAKNPRDHNCVKHINI